MAEIVVPVAGDVNGDITSCKIETAKVSVERKGAWSITQKENFTTYNVCTKEVISQFSAQSITGGGFMIIFIGIVLLLLVIEIITSAIAVFRD